MTFNVKSSQLPLVIFDEVTVGYGAAVVLEGLNFNLAAGELVGVIGRSGAGKSTLISALCGGDVVLGGKLTVNGQDPRTVNHPVGFVPQINDEVISRLSIEEVVTLGNPRRGLFTSRSERVAAAALLERLGLAGYGRRRLDELSGGQRQRVAIARALTASSALLLCDEPTSGADPVLAVEIADVLAEVAAQGTTVVVATHDLAVVAPRLHRLIGITNGRVMFDGSPTEFGASEQSAVYGSAVSGGAR